MKVIDLYRYEDGENVVITPNKANETDTPNKYRLVADDGMKITDGELIIGCVDIPIDDGEKWYEIEAPIEEEEMPEWV